MTVSSILRAVITVEFPEANPQGQEQTGIRPAVVVGAPDLIDTPLYGGLIVVPFTSRVEKFIGHSRVLYPIIPAGAGGLTVESVALCDQVRFVSRMRVLGYLGHLTDDEFQPIDHAVRRLLGH